MKRTCEILELLFLIDEENEKKIEENAQGYKEGFSKGKLTAARKEYSNWFNKAAGWSIGCTIIGAGGMYLYSNSYCDYPTSIPLGSPEYKKGFQDGYIHTTRAKRNSATLIGGLMGMFVLPVTLIGGVFLILASIP